MDEILTFSKRPEDDFYYLLGCDDNSSVEQILTEYKLKALQYHPDKNPDDQDAVDHFKKLQNAKEVLCDPEQRKLYDKWKSGGFSMPFKKWANLSKSSHTSMHWANRKVKEHMLLPGTSSTNCKDSCENQEAGETNVVETRKYWVSEPGNEMLRRFRSYEI